VINRLLDQLEDASMVNLVGWYENGHWQLVLFPRKAHRPSCYNATDLRQRLISPAAVENVRLVGGHPRKKDLLNLTAEDVKTIYFDVAWSDDDVAALTPRLTLEQEPTTIDVGIVTGVSIGVYFPQPYTLNGQTGKKQIRTPP
jgi:hypothetical protein